MGKHYYVIGADVALQVVQQEPEPEQGGAAPQKRGEYGSLAVWTTVFA